MLESNANSPSMGFQALDLCQLHDRTANILQTLSRKIGAGNVLGERRKVDP